MKASTPYCKK